jgi:hypothetical protein
MSKKRHKGHADKREPGAFIALPVTVLGGIEFATLSSFALKALMDLLVQYRGDNNGDLCAAWTVMARRGWRSRDSLAKGLRELRERDFIVVTRQGGRHRATLYAVTFFAIDGCGGKLDIEAPTRRFMGSWRKSPIAMHPRLPALSRSAGHSVTKYPAGSATASVSA